MKKHTQKGVTLIELLIVVAIIGILLALLFGGKSVTTEAAVVAIESYGFTNVTDVERHAIGYLHGCADDEIAFTATATNPQSHRIAVVACTNSYNKGWTVRIQK